jgi:hypothetical protein
VAMVPLTVAVAVTCKGEPTDEPLAGAQIFTPSEAGAAQPEEPVAVGKTARAYGVGMLSTRRNCLR